MLLTNWLLMATKKPKKRLEKNKKHKNVEGFEDGFEKGFEDSNLDDIAEFHPDSDIVIIDKKRKRKWKLVK